MCEESCLYLNEEEIFDNGTDDMLIALYKPVKGTGHPGFESNSMGSDRSEIFSWREKDQRRGFCPPPL